MECAGGRLVAAALLTRFTVITHPTRPCLPQWPTQPTTHCILIVVSLSHINTICASSSSKLFPSNYEENESMNFRKHDNIKLLKKHLYTYSQFMVYYFIAKCRHLILLGVSQFFTFYKYLIMGNKKAGESTVI